MTPANRPHLGSPRRALLALLACLGLLLSALALAPPASAATGNIGGVVSGASGPLEGIDVVAFVPNPADPGSWLNQGSATTDATGHYTIAGLTTGAYRVGFTDPTNAYATEYFIDTNSLNSALSVTVASGGTTTVNATLALASRITGTVTDSAGTGIENILVTSYWWDDGIDEWIEGQKAVTDDLGYYEVPRLSRGPHRIWFSTFGPTLGKYTREYWVDAATLATATSIAVPPAGTASGIDAVLASQQGSARIQGVVSGLGGVVPGATVVSYSYDAGADVWVERTHTTTSGTGAYTLGGLVPGTYRVGFEHTDHFTEYWNDAATPADGTSVTVGVSGTASGISAQLTPVPITNVTPPSLSGQAVVGGTLTATAGTWKPGSGFTFSYEWLSDGTPMAGITGTTYQPVSGDIGHGISVRVTASRSSEAPGTATSVQTAPVEQLVVTNNTPPTVTGTPQVDQTLSATTGTWTPSTGVAFAYQWFVGGVEVNGATASTYLVRPADAGSAVTVRVTGTKALHTPAAATSLPTGSVALAPLTNTVAPAISGSASIGGTLTASSGTWSPNTGLLFGYQWYVDGVLVDGATTTTYVPVEADYDKTVTVVVSATRPGYQPASQSSAATSAVSLSLLTNTAAPTLTGTPQVGGTLTADSGAWNPEDEITYDYEWMVGGVPAGTDQATYSPTADDVGKSVLVRVTATRSGFAPTTASSTPTAAVYQPTANTVAPKVTGTPQVGLRLTALVGTWSPSGLTYQYQWLVNGAPVAGQTASTFTVPPTALNKTVAVRVTGSGSGPALVVTSAPTLKVKAGVLKLVRAPTVAGTARVGQTLRSTAGTVSPAATKVTYQWLRNGRAIRGATRATYRLVAGDRGRKVSLKVSYVRTGYTTLARTTRVLTVR